MKKIVTYILAFIALTSIFLASGIKDVANWWDIAKPFFIIWFISVSIALIINNTKFIKRVIYSIHHNIAARHTNRGEHNNELY